MEFIPNFPLHINLTVLLSALLILGLIGGEITKFNPFLPRILGYIFIGFLIGPSLLNLTTPAFLYNSHIFIDIALGLILFELGRQLDVVWLRHDYHLLSISLTESFLTFLLALAILKFQHLSWLASILAATVVIATSPAIVIMIAHDLSAQGPVTRHSLILTSLNNFFGLTLFALFLPLAQKNLPTNLLFTDAIYHFIGSIALGLSTFLLLAAIAWLLGKNKENQFIACISVVVLAIALSYVFNLSAMLVVFILGVSCRNLDRKHLIMEIDFLWLARIFLVFLFVITGMYLKFQSLLHLQVILVSLLLIFARLIAKFSGVCLFAKKTGLTQKQAFLISASLLPMACVALGMLNTARIVNVELGDNLATVILPILATLAVITPISTQFCFIKAGETDRE